MNRIALRALLLLMLVLLATGVALVRESALHAAMAAHPTVEIVKTDKGYELRRNGQPYFIKGAAGNGSKQLLKEDGGNSMRTWSADGADADYAEANHYGLTMTQGIWLGHKDQGFDYHNLWQVWSQYFSVRQQVLRLKDQPALLMWGLGNEMEAWGMEKDPSPVVWQNIEAMAKMMKHLDPNHPIMVAVKDITNGNIEALHHYCPDVDIVGINSYDGWDTLAQRYRAHGGTKPYILSEFGPYGPWTYPWKKNSWGALSEPSSTQKATLYEDAYRACAADPLCLGSYAFLWGSKQEISATWFGMFLPDGAKLGAVDAMAEMWGQKSPHPAPEILDISVREGARVAPGALVHAELKAANRGHDPLDVDWVLQSDVIEPSSDGFVQPPPTHPEAIVAFNIRRAVVRMPQSEGAYRLYAYIHNRHGGAAVANVPLFVVRVPK